MKKGAGVGSGSNSQRYGSGDPNSDPYQNVTDPQHCHRETLTQWYITFKRGGWGFCSLVLCSLATVTSCIDASVRMVTRSPQVGRLIIFCISLVQVWNCLHDDGLEDDPEELDKGWLAALQSLLKAINVANFAPTSVLHRQVYTCLLLVFTIISAKIFVVGFAFVGLGHTFYYFKRFLQCSGSVTFCYGSGCGCGSSDPYLWLTDMDADPDPDHALFVIDLQDAKKNYFSLEVFMLIPF
jgi:hypothetical protein